MKFSFLFVSLLLLANVPLRAATAEQEKAFVDKYKQAFEAKDQATLQSFLYTKGADPNALEFYKMMQSDGIGGKVSQIELVALTPEDEKKAAAPQQMPGTPALCLSVKPNRKLVIKVENKDANGSSSNSSEVFIAEKDGKLVIPVPAACK